MTEQIVEPSTGSTPTTRAGGMRWTPILSLAAGIAILVASEFLPAGVLPLLAADLGISEGRAGLAVAATAIAGAITAPSIAVVLPRTNRRTVLVSLLLIGALANLLVALSPNFVVLLLGRLLLGVAVAGYWSFAFAAGIRAVPGRNAVISTTLATGTSVATILGVPLGSLLGDILGWRLVFGGAALLMALAAVAVALTLGSVPAHASAGFTMLRRALANRRLLLGIGVLFVSVMGNFIAYPYIRLGIERIDADAVPWMLAAWGIGGFFGNFLAGALARWLRFDVTLGPLVFGAALIGVAAAQSPTVLLVALIAWGLGFSVVPVSTQLWVTTVEPERTESALALQVTAFQLAIMLGSSIGGALVDGLGLGWVFGCGAALALLGALGFGMLPAAASSRSAREQS